LLRVFGLVSCSLGVVASFALAHSLVLGSLSVLVLLGISKLLGISLLNVVVLIFVSLLLRQVLDDPVGGLVSILSVLELLEWSLVPFTSFVVLGVPLFSEISLARILLLLEIVSTLLVLASWLGLLVLLCRLALDSPDFVRVSEIQLSVLRRSLFLGLLNLKGSELISVTLAISNEHFLQL
jgi:hypothetical protein